MKAYIAGAATISAQLSFNSSLNWTAIGTYKEKLPAIEPDYKEFISPIKMRRMNRIVKMGVAAVTACLKTLAIEKPDAIITATGWGCLSDTYKFLDELIEKKEESLSPATFIQSTHNTVGGQIALYLDCQEYNSIYVNHITSLEHGLLDALMLLSEGKNNVLIGGIDELTDTDYNLKKKSGFWKVSAIENMALLDSNSQGTMAGEGAAFFLLTNTPGEHSLSCIDGVVFSSADDSPVKIKSVAGLDMHDIDLVVSGFNGDIRLKSKYDNFYKAKLANKPVCYYKHLCGEYDTASGFALWIANEIIKTQEIPGYLFIDGIERNLKEINRILIHHLSEPDTHAFILVSKTSI